MGTTAPRIQLVYFDAGGGHASAARALAAVLRERPPRAEVTLVNLQEVLAPLDIVRRITGLQLQECYNQLLAREWTWGFGMLVRPLQGLIALRAPAVRRALAEYWRRNPPDLVVSVIPHFNRLMVEALRQATPAAFMAEVITDFADTPPGFWLQGVADRIFCGTALACQQSLAAGYPPDRITATSGMVLRPSFYAAVPDSGAEFDRKLECERLGLTAGVPTALILLGGTGSRQMLTIAEQLERLPDPLQAIFICGRDAATAAALRARPSRHPRLVEGYTDQVPAFMRLADFFIGKPGPGAISEAVAMRLPAIVVRNSRTMPQERYNVRWLTENGLGLEVRSWKDLDQAVATLLRPGVLTAYRSRAAAIHNRAVFEIAEELRDMVQGTRASAPSDTRVVRESVGRPHSGIVA